MIEHEPTLPAPVDETTGTEASASGFSKALLDKVASLPPEPGVYLYKNSAGKIIYVGKAKNLKSRVRSYFQTLDPAQFKTAFLVKRITDFDYIITRNEKEAFLLENTLIKKHMPRYNIRLRDDKDYVSLRLNLGEAWPRLEIVRRPQAKKDIQLFGPYSSAGAVRETLVSLHRIFPLRPCTNGKFTQYKRRGRPCMDYQLKKCPGPCCDLINKPDYAEMVKGATLFLRGRRKDLVTDLHHQMAAAAESEDFEKAASLRDQIKAIEQTLTTQSVARYHVADTHVIGLHREGEMVTVVVLVILDGKLEDKSEFFFPDLPEDNEVILSDFISQFYLRTETDGIPADGVEADKVRFVAARSIPNEILVPVDVPGVEVFEEMLTEAAGHKVVVSTPQRGSRADLRDTAALNAVESFRKKKESENLAEVPLKLLQEKLALHNFPRRIECYDISNTMGTGAVGSMVVFTNAKPDRAEYRRFRIKTIMQADDFAMMGEVLRRRLTRGKEEGSLPDLILVDGGKGQLAVAVHMLKELGIDTVDVAGLAKARVQEDHIYSKEVSQTEERLFKPNRKNPVVLARNSSALHLVTHLRDEAHRFAITYHRLLRHKGIKSSLADIQGVGAKRQKALLRHFGSVRAMKEATLEAMVGVAGMNRAVAERVYAFLHLMDHAEGVAQAPAEGPTVEDTAFAGVDEQESTDDLEDIEEVSGEQEGDEEEFPEEDLAPEEEVVMTDENASGATPPEEPGVE